MAATQKRIDIILGAREASKAAFDRVERRLDRVKRLAVGVTAAAGISLGAVGLATQMRETVAAGMEYEAQISNIAAISSRAVSELAPLVAMTKELGLTTQYSASQAAEAAAQFTLAGFSIEETTKALPATLSLAAAGELEMAEAATIAAQTMKQMGLTADELPAVVDVMARSFTTANTDLRLLGEAFVKVGRIGRGAGADITQISAALQLLADEGLRGEEAGTALRNIYLRLQSGVEGVDKALEELGVSVADETGKMKPLSVLVGELNEALGRYVPVKQAAIRATLAGTRAAAAFDILLGSGQAKLERYERALQDVGGTADDIAATKLDNLKGAITRARSATEGLRISTTELVNGGLRPMVEGLAMGIAHTSVFISENQELITVLAAGTVALVGMKVAMWGLNAAGAGFLKMKLGDAFVSLVYHGLRTRIMLTSVTGAMVAQRVAAVALRATTLLLRGAMVGGLVVGLGLVATALVRARRESVSYSEAMRRLLVDIGLFSDAAERAEAATRSYNDARAEMDAARAAVDEAKSIEDRAVAQERLVAAIEAAVEARKKERAEGFAAELQAARDELKTAKGLSGQGARNKRSRVAAAQAEVDRLQGLVANDGVGVKLAEELKKAQGELATLEAQVERAPGLDFGIEKAMKEGERGFDRFLKGVLAGVDELQRRVRQAVKLEQETFTFTATPLEAELDAIRKEAADLRWRTQQQVNLGRLSEDEAAERQKDIDRAERRKLEAAAREALGLGRRERVEEEDQGPTRAALPAGTYSAGEVSSQYAGLADRFRSEQDMARMQYEQQKKTAEESKRSAERLKDILDLLGVKLPGIGAYPVRTGGMGS